MTPTAMLLSLAERANLLFFSFDLTAGRFTYVNPAFASFFSLEKEVFETDTLFAMVHTEDQKHIISQYKALLEEKPIRDMESRFEIGNNERWLRINPFLSTENGVNLVMGYAEDITAYKQHSNTLNDHSNKKNSILNIMTHDLAGPIGTIGNLSDLLTRETAQLSSSRVSEYIGLIKKISKNCIHLIRDFLDKEFLESTGTRLLKKRVELVGKIKNVTEEYLGMQKDLKMHFFCKANKDIIYVNIDEDKFLQVINNLISNALKFTPDGGSITINVEESQGSVMVSVADTGIGIPQKHHATLFDKFSEARRTGLHGEHSTGLGMSIIKTIVEWHSGKIWFNSEEGKGTTFYIQLPG